MSLILLLWVYFQKDNWHILSGIFPLIFLWYFSMVKVMWKASSEESLFPDLVCHFFLFLYLYHSSTTCYSWILFLKQKVVHCVLSFWLVYVMLRSYMLMLFPNLWISSQMEPDLTLCSISWVWLTQTPQKLLTKSPYIVNIWIILFRRKVARLTTA